MLLPAGPLPVPPLQPSLISQSSSAAGEKRCDPTPLRAAVKKQRALEPEAPQDNSNRALRFLCDELEARAVASDAFPPEISCSHIRASIYVHS